jgi:hypothetical protein
MATVPENCQMIIGYLESNIAVARRGSLIIQGDFW